MIVLRSGNSHPTDISAINLGVVARIFASWIVTIPAGAALTVTFFFALKFLLG